MDSGTLMAFYDAIIKEEMASVLTQSLQRALQGKLTKVAKKKESVITEAPGLNYRTPPDKMSN